MVWLVSQTVCFVVTRLADGKVTSCHVNDPSKARIKILKRFQRMGFTFFFNHAKILVREKCFSLSYLSRNHPKAGKKILNFRKPALYSLSCFSVTS